MDEIEQSVIRVQDVRESAEDAASLGYEVESADEERAVLIRRRYGGWREHLLVGLLTVPFTFGAGNLAWAVYSYYRRPSRRVLRQQRG